VAIQPIKACFPVDRYDGVSIRSAFKAPAGYQFVAADYSQIELRVLAYLAQDEQLRDAFLHDKDIHAATASKLFGVPLDQVSHDQRQIGKRINFSVLYGLTPYGLSRELGISMKDAKYYIETYFAQYPQVALWMDKIIADTKVNGYVTTLYGRRRYLPGIFEKNRTLYEMACRMAVNTVAQGTAAEIMKLGMLALERNKRLQEMGIRLVLQIHDELLVAVPEAYASEAASLIAHELEHVVSWDIPLRVSVRVGPDWGVVTK